MPAATMIYILGATLLAAGWALWLLPVGTCSECAHCQAEKLARKRADEVRTARYYAIPLCPHCGEHHLPEDGHRT